ncbi:DAPG hydrolase family protein [Mycolicibacterium celeriflavum]|uniref:DAPG hydrolase family protein n=1 Tax=Mycolicibacterium celeriflavum TaxID=1249101 RepID=UPI003CEE7571
MKSYLGYRGDDFSADFAEFYDPEMSALPGHVVEALEHGPQAEPTLPAFDDIVALRADGYQQTENGYGVLRDGGIQVSVRTDMPGVTPAMWDWWFGWHGSDSRRYKLWHPRAHVSARWGDGDGDGGYVGRTSLVEEYLGSSFTRPAIQFVPPSDLGLSDLGDGVAICARLGSSDVPVDVGWLVHQVRTTPDGSEMRSRFWMGGRHVAVRGGNRLADRVVRPVAARQLPDPRDLMVHCAQEMNHLAAFLPELFTRFSRQ